MSSALTPHKEPSISVTQNYFSIRLSLISIFLIIFPLSVFAEGMVDEPRFESKGRGAIVNGVSYPDAALHLPISFVRAKANRVGVFANYVNRVRNLRNVYGCQPDCSDAELSLDLSLYNNGKHSFSLLPGLQSLTSRNNGTKQGQGGFLGFRYALQITETLGFSAGGEHLIRLDNTVDLGRNGFFGFSKAFGITDGNFFIANIGLGSGRFSLYREPWIETSFNRDRRAKGANPDNLDFGPVGSIAYFPSEYLSLGMEYSGYGLGAGLSFKVLRNFDLFATFYIYDFVQLSNGPNFEVTPNLFGNLTYTF